MLLPPLRIAILDDDQSVRVAIGRLLRSAGMDVTTFTSGLELLHFLEHDKLDCVVLDLQMPGMSGSDVLHYFAHAGIRVPTIIITAHDESGSQETCLAAGACAYLRKPLSADKLIDAIEEATTPHTAIER